MSWRVVDPSAAQAKRGVMGEVIERCLNHVEQNKLKRIYQRYELKGKQKEAWRLLGERRSLLYNDQEENIVMGKLMAKTR